MEQNSNRLAVLLKYIGSLPVFACFLSNSRICRLKLSFCFRKQLLCFGKMPFYFVRFLPFSIMLTLHYS